MQIRIISLQIRSGGTPGGEELQKAFQLTMKLQEEIRPLLPPVHFSYKFFQKKKINLIKKILASSWDATVW